MGSNFAVLKLIDSAVYVSCFVMPLYFFPEKSKIIVQLIIGLMFAVAINIGASFNRLAIYRNVIPLIEGLYGPIFGFSIALFNLSFFAFIYHEYQLSRYVNGTAVILILVYLIVSRRIIFGPLVIGNQEGSFGTDGQVLERTVKLEQSPDCDDRVAKIITFDKSIVDDNANVYVSIEGNPWMILFSKIKFHNQNPVLLINGPIGSQFMYSTNSITKILLDRFLSALLIVTFLPIGLLIFFLTLLFQQEWPIFSQKRVGRFGKQFKMLKFKSFFGSPARITWWGRILRRSNFDELPQLINILRGEMSFVGPRAEIPEKVNTTFEMSLRNLSPPGLTGYWQLSPYRDSAISSHVEYDIYYMLTRSTALDLLVIALTPLFAFSNNAKK